VFRVVRAVFEKFGAGLVSLADLTASQAVKSQRGGLTTLGKVSRFLLVVAFPCSIAALVQGECALAHGELVKDRMATREGE
jgi:hypothetical protein